MRILLRQKESHVCNAMGYLFYCVSRFPFLIPYMMHFEDLNVLGAFFLHV